MRIDVIGKHLEITDAITSYASGKAEKLLKFFDGTQQIAIVCEQQPHNNFAVEVRVDVVKHKAFIAHATGTDLYAAIDSAVDKAGRQIKDFKDQLKAH
ncbi:MAG: ribosome-associated translation inhibitor RaiA [Pyrinomonadaceae bacterium]|nr:ribosome-associated translation inhibitor RaiA [Phycisphaerales bacterium]